MVPLLAPFKASGEKIFIFRKCLWICFFFISKLARNENRSMNDNENTYKHPSMCWAQSVISVLPTLSATDKGNLSEQRCHQTSQLCTQLQHPNEKKTKHGFHTKLLTTNTEEAELDHSIQRMPTFLLVWRDNRPKAEKQSPTGVVAHPWDVVMCRNMKKARLD